jgi:predicted phage terminase large subunit-like protein
MDAARRLAIQLEAQQDFYFFVRRMFHARRGYRWLHNWHHETICRALERVFRGECTRLIINVPPRYSKTELAVVNFIAWSLGKHPDAEFIHTSYSAQLATNNAFGARLLVESDEYRDIFPRVALRHDSSSKGDWRTTEGGVVYAQGSGGTITGFGAGKMRDGFGGAIIIDDPHKASEASSDTTRRNVIDWFQNTLETRKNSPRTPIILIMQRLHEADLAGFLLAGGNGEKWENVVLPAISDAAEPLWPIKHSLEQLRVMERASPYVFSGQYQQRPAPLAGGEFKPDTMQTIEAIPAGTRLARAWDFAGTDDDGDWTAGALLGQMPDGRYIVADMVRFRAGPEQVEATLRATAQRDTNRVPVAIPQDPGQAGKMQAKTFTRALAGFSVSSKPVSGDKVTRARPLAAQVNVGNVVLLRGEWNAALIQEMRNFPNGLNDDQVDALSLAFDYFNDNSLGLLDYYRQQADEAAKMRALVGAT